MPHLKSKGGDLVTELMSDRDWQLDLAFLVDITQHLNTQNTRLQGRDQLIIVLLENVRGFQMIVTLFRNQMKEGKLINFKTMSSLVNEFQNLLANFYKRYENHLDVLENNFKNRFNDLRGRERNLALFSRPFSVNAEYFDDNPDLQLEILDFQSSLSLNGSFKELNLEGFYKQLYTMNKDQFPKNNGKCIFLGSAVWQYIRLRAVLFFDENNKVETSITTYRWSSRYRPPTSDFAHHTKSR